MESNDNIRTVCVDGRECLVLYAYIYAGDFFEIWLEDAETEKITHLCTKPLADVPLNERQVLVRDEYLDVLSEAGIVQPTGETIDAGGHGRLHKCDVPNRERVPIHEQAHSPAVTGEWVRSSIEIEQDALERDAGDEFEL
jgi:hypothetical protein